MYLFHCTLTLSGKNTNINLRELLTSNRKFVHRVNFVFLLHDKKTSLIKQLMQNSFPINSVKKTRSVILRSVYFDLQICLPLASAFCKVCWTVKFNSHDEIYTNSAACRMSAQRTHLAVPAHSHPDVISFFRVRRVDRAMHELVWPVFYLQSD